MSSRLLRSLRSSGNSFGRLHQLPSRPIPLSSRSNLASRRSASTTATATATEAGSLLTRSKNILYGTSITLFFAFGYLYVTDTRASIHQWLVVPSLRYIYPDAEDAHHAGTKALKILYSIGLNPRDRAFRATNADAADLSVSVFGHKLDNPIGTSAGLDKLAEIPDALFDLGPAIVEVGGCTPFAQEGNPKPRVFRIPSQKALINRYGLNSLGADDMAMRLRERVRLFAYKNGLGVGSDAERMVLDGEVGVPPGSLHKGKLLAVQVAKNKDTKDEDIEAVKRDYVYCVERLAPYADILVVNVSSPNTPGLRTLQKVEPLTRILEGVVGAAKSTNRKTKPRVMVKVSPDEDQDEQIEGIVEAIWRSGVDGVIVGNTTKRREKVIPNDITISPRERRILEEQGGYSGPQMFERTLSLVKRYRSLLDQGPNQERKVVFATGGITNGKQALEILNAGASVAQVYTAMVYSGAGTVTRIKKEMSDEINKKRL
ncbi:dihydroorotate reductase protein [Rutstroemia sp. NJR-2017a WRK4]|nr:dihydroorotate reductase protein [Rutstroemia sp. NJR-2017a WRK4]